VTVRESASALTEPRTVVVRADYDEYLDAAYCPLCGGEADDVGTPHVPARLLEETIDEDLPVFGWRCDCRRVDVVLPAPDDVAPDHFESVDVLIDGEVIAVATPEPALAEAA
jgi:hypothetical protein